MDILFNSLFTNLIFMIAIICFGKLPRRIEAMYYKENILSESRRIIDVFEYILMSLWIGSSVFFVINYGFKKFYTYYFIGFCVLLAILILYSQFMIKYKNLKRTFSKKVYFAAEGIANEVLSVNEKYPNVKLKISVGGSVMYIIIESDNKDLVPGILDKLRNEKILFQDLSDNKFRKKLLLESIFFSLSMVYLVSFLIYVIAH